jgi:hypothetical protein
MINTQKISWMNPLQIAILSLLITLLFSGCSYNRLATKMVSPAFDPFIESLFAEPDLELAKGAFEADIKMIEGLRLMHDTPELRLKNAMALFGYSFIYCDGIDNERAGKLYLRAKKIAMAEFDIDPFELKEDEFNIWLSELDKNDLPALFWTAFSYGSWMKINLASNEAAFKLPRVEAMVRQCLGFDESYFFAAGHLFLGALDCIKPRFIGGKPERGLEQFRRAGELSGQGLLLPLVFEAEFYCPATLNEARFDELRLSIGEARDNEPEEFILMNAFARRKMAELVSRRAELF